jgi:hypothetical protein
MADHAHAGVGGFGASNTGQTAGNTGTSAGTWVLAASTNVTVSQSTGAGGVHTLWLSGPNPGAGGGIASLANSQTTYTSGLVILSAQANVTIASSVDGASQYFRVSAPAPGGGAGGTIHFTSVGNNASFSFHTLGAGSVALQQMPLQCELQIDRAVLPVSVSVITGTNSSGSVTLSLYAGFFSKNANTLSLVTSATTSYTGYNTSNGSTASYSGIRMLSIPFAATLSAGDYWFALMTRITTAGNSVFAVSNMVASNLSTVASGLWGAASNASVQIFGLGVGHLSVTSAAMPGSIAFADIQLSNYYRRQLPCVMLGSGTA